MKQWLCALLAVLMLCGLAACTQDKTPDKPQGPTEAELTAVRENLQKKSEMEGLSAITAMELYENGVRVAHDDMVQVRDNKKMYYTGDTKRVVNYPDGYRLDMPADWTPDYSLATARSRYVTDELTLIASDETDTMFVYNYARDMEDPLAIGKEYVRATFQYITAQSYVSKNGVTILSEETIDRGDREQLYVLKMHVGDFAADMKSYYTYAVLYTDLRIVHMMFKCVDDRDFADVYTSVKLCAKKGAAVDTVTYPAGDNPAWNSDTKAVYDYMMNTSETMWGIYTTNLKWGGVDDLRFKMTERYVDHKFTFVSTYTDDMNEPFPLIGANQAHDDGRIIQFTFHMEEGFGNTMAQKAPLLDVYRGKYDERFRELAREIIAFGHPILMRVNNEMNSDWTTWSAINTMCDPEIFNDTWIRLYDIFEEEGANAYCIWVWNPQSEHSFPDANWNDIRTYMPGADYVDMVGLTSYNFGSEYEWQSFEQLYQVLEDYFSVQFGDWGWIISEFGCSDNTEDDSDRKAQWITDMFTCLDEGIFPNIKVAVWFNANDYYADGTIMREIAITDDKKSREAFKAGLAD